MIAVRKKRIITVLFAFVAACTSLQIAAQTSSAEKEKKAKQYIDSISAANGIPGICFSFMDAKGYSANLAAGLSDKESNTPMKPASLLLSGSAPKMFFATIAMMLQEEKKWSIDDKLEKYIGHQSWYARIPNAGAITIRHLLNHSSGVLEYYEVGDFIKRLHSEPDRVWKPEELAAYVLDQKPLFEVGKGFGYSDMNYILLGLAIESVTKKEVYKLVKEKILQPLGMKNTFPSTSRTIKGLQKGYSPANSPFGFSGPTIVNGKFVINPQFEWCGGGFASTTSDWILFISGLMKGKLVSETTLTMMKETIKANTGPNEAYGLGLQVRPSQLLGKGFGHGGWFPGYLTEVEYFPEKNVFVAIQYNTDDFSKIKGHPRQHLVRLAAIIAQ